MSQKYSPVNTHILLVEHDKNLLAAAAKVLLYNAYKVTAVETGKEAGYILSKGTKKTDLVLMDAQMPDLDTFSILDLATGFEIPTIITFNDENATLAQEAIERGACFLLQKPISPAMVKSIWQHAMKQKMTNAQKQKTTNAQYIRGEKRSNAQDMSIKPLGERKPDHENDEVRKIIIKKRSKATSMTDNDMKASIIFKWTDELHEKFVAAVSCIGGIFACDARDVSRLIKLMDNPDLTQMQVASHLQKCRQRAEDLKRRGNLDFLYQPQGGQ